MFIFRVTTKKTTRYALTEAKAKPTSFHPSEYIRCRIIGNYPSFEAAKRGVELRKSALREAGLLS